MAVVPQAETPLGQDLRSEERGLSREWRSFWRNPLAIAGMTLLVLLVLFSWVGPLVYRTNAFTMSLQLIVHGPMPGHPFGTDALGRDVLSRLMLGGQLSLIVGFASAVVTMVFGTFYGLMAAQFGGWLDSVLMRMIDITIAIPSLYFLLLLDSIFIPNATIIIFIIAVTGWQTLARVVRSEVLSLRERDYVEAARAAGSSWLRIMLRHYLPNLMGSIVVYTTFQVGNGIITLATLSFLGLGLPPPAPNWGQTVADSMNYMFQNAYWLIYPAGLLIVFAQLSINFLGDALNQAFDPRLREGR